MKPTVMMSLNFITFRVSRSIVTWNQTLIATNLKTRRISRISRSVRRCSLKTSWSNPTLISESSYKRCVRVSLKSRELSSFKKVSVNGTTRKVIQAPSLTMTKKRFSKPKRPFLHLIKPTCKQHMAHLNLMPPASNVSHRRLDHRKMPAKVCKKWSEGAFKWLLCLLTRKIQFHKNCKRPRTLSEIHLKAWQNSR